MTSKGSTTRARRAMTLIETTAAIGIMAVIMGVTAFAARIMVVGAATLERRVESQSSAQRAIARLRNEVRFALTVPELTARTIAFSHPDVTGDGVNELIRYAWSGVAGEALTREVNGGGATDTLVDCRRFDLLVDLGSEDVPGTAGYGPETIIAAHSQYPDGYSYATRDHTVTAMKWLAESFTPTMNGATTCVITRVRMIPSLPAGRIGGALSVSLHRTLTATAAPSGTALAAAVLRIEASASNHAWQEAVFPEEPVLQVGQGASIVLATGGTNEVNIEYQMLSSGAYDDNPNGQMSSDGGQIWVPGVKQDTFDLRMIVYGRYPSAQVASPTVRSDVLKAAFFSLETGEGAARSVIDGGINCLNEPPVVGVTVDAGIIRSRS